MKFVKTLALGAIIVGFSATAIPSFAATTTTPAPKLIDVRTCPGTGEKVVGAGAGNEIVGNYRVFFCCGGCQPEYDKLSKAQKLAKAKALAKAATPAK